MPAPPPLLPMPSFLFSASLWLAPGMVRIPARFLLGHVGTEGHVPIPFWDPIYISVTLTDTLATNALCALEQEPATADLQ